jgi:hypothetical protein
MSLSQRLLSAFIVFHLLAITIGAIPAADVLPKTSRSTSVPTNVISHSVTPILDSLVPSVAVLQAAAWTAVSPLRPFARTYLKGTRQFERWNMFSRPTLGDEYVSLRYYSASPGRTLLRGYSEIVYPSHPQGSVRLVQSYMDSFRDKAMASSLERYLLAFSSAVKRSGLDASARAQEHLAPIIRAFARRYSPTRLDPDERLVRADLWYGFAPTPPPGEVVSDEMREARTRVVDAYDHSELGVFPAADLPPVGAVTEEADIRWKLLAEVVWK